MEAHDQERQAHSTILMIFTLLSRILGIFKARVLAVLFGATVLADVINFTFNIPNNFRKLFAEGAFNSAFIPIFTRSLQDRKETRVLLRRMLSVQVGIFTVITLFIIVFREYIITFLSDFRDPQMISLSGNLLIFFTLYLAMISLYALFNGVLNAHGTFITGAIAPLIFSVTLILSLYLLEPVIGAYAMAVGVIAGGGGQLAFTWRGVRRYGYRFALTRDVFTPEVRQVMRKWFMITLNSLIMIISQQVAYYFATTMETGSVTSFSNAIIIWQAPYGIFYAAIATAFFPSLVRAAGDGDRSALHHTTSHGMTLILATLLPNLLLLSFFGSETASVLLQSGQFTLTDSIRTGSALRFFAFGMPFAALYGFFQRICYADDRERDVFIVSLVVAVVDITLTILLIRYRRTIGSIALANSIAFAVGVVIYLIHLSRRNLIRVFTAKVLGTLSGILVINGLLAILLSYADSALGTSWWQNGSSLLSLGILALMFSMTFLAALLLYRLMGIRVISFLTNRKQDSKKKTTTR